jgi:hypothetical protein
MQHQVRDRFSHLQILSPDRRQAVSVGTRSLSNIYRRARRIPPDVMDARLARGRSTLIRLMSFVLYGTIHGRP